MRAIRIHELTGLDALRLEEIPSPSPGPGEIRVAVHAAGVNFADTLMIKGGYQHKPPLPFTPGMEAAGDVVEVGEGVTEFAVGDRVLAPMRFGAYAEEAAIDARHCVRIPDGMDYRAGAAFPIAYGTSHLALTHRTKLKAGEVLLVLGASGGVGLTAVEVGKALGATVIACAGSAEKLAVARSRGADHLIDYSAEDIRARIKDLTGGVDVVYDPVGGQYSEPALRSTAWNGRFLVVGFAAGDIPRIPLNLPLLKGCQIVGVFWGAFVGREPDQYRADVDQLVQWWSDGKLTPHVSATYPLERASEAIAELAERRVKGKVVVVSDAYTAT